MLRKYREICREIQAPASILEEIIQMEEKNTRHHRPVKAAAILAAALAAMVVDVSAAVPGIRLLFTHVSMTVNGKTVDESQMVTVTLPRRMNASLEERDGRAILIVEGQEGRHRGPEGRHL